MQVPSTQREHFTNGCFSPLLLFYFKINFCSAISPKQLFPGAPHTNLKILKSFSFKGPRRRGKKNKPPDGKYKPSAGVMHKIPDTFFFSKIKHFCWKGENWGKEPQHTNAGICYMHQWIPGFCFFFFFFPFFGFIFFLEKKKNKLI